MRRKIGLHALPLRTAFDVPEGFEENIAAIGAIANETPFLLLKNELARLSKALPARRNEAALARLDFGSDR